MSAPLLQQVRTVRNQCAEYVTELDELERRLSRETGGARARSQESGVRHPRIRIKVVKAAEPAGPVVEVGPAASPLPPTAVEALAAVQTPAPVPVPAPEPEPAPEPARKPEPNYSVRERDPAKAAVPSVRGGGPQRVAFKAAVHEGINALPAESGIRAVLQWLDEQRPELLKSHRRDGDLATYVSDLINQAKASGHLQAVAPGVYRRLRLLPVPSQTPAADELEARKAALGLNTSKPVA